MLVLVFWCERWDLNPYGITTRPSNVRVCRFRHSRICRVSRNDMNYTTAEYRCQHIFLFYLLFFRITGRMSFYCPVFLDVLCQPSSDKPFSELSSGAIFGTKYFFSQISSLHITTHSKTISLPFFIFSPKH